VRQGGGNDLEGAQTETCAEGEVEIYLHSFLTLELDGDECSVLRNGRFNSEVLI
jgi:hypothetical protein